MKKYDYYEAVKEDVKNYIENNINFDEFEGRGDLESYLNDELWLDDSVTGNGSGSYTFNTYIAEEYLCHNLFLLKEALDSFGCTDINVLEKGTEWCDVSIRCYLLNECISEVLDNYYL